MLHSGPAVKASHSSCDLRAAGLRGHHATCVLQHECVGLGQNDSPMMPSDRCCTKALPGKSCIFGPPAGRMQAMKQQGIFLVAYLLLDPDENSKQPQLWSRPHDAHAGLSIAVNRPLSGQRMSCQKPKGGGQGLHASVVDPLKLSACKGCPQRLT